VMFIVYQVVYGQTNESIPEQSHRLLIYDQHKTILDYCFNHASDPNPVQDLVDKGLVDAYFNGMTCLEVKQSYINQSQITTDDIQRYKGLMDDKIEKLKERQEILKERQEILKERQERALK
jgi:hypothetical protein